MRRDDMLAGGVLLDAHLPGARYGVCLYLVPVGAAARALRYSHPHVTPGGHRAHRLRDARIREIHQTAAGLRIGGRRPQADADDLAAATADPHRTGRVLDPHPAAAGLYVDVAGEVADGDVPAAGVRLDGDRGRYRDGVVDCAVVLARRTFRGHLQVDARPLLGDRGLVRVVLQPALNGDRVGRARGHRDVAGGEVELDALHRVLVGLRLILERQPVRPGQQVPCEGTAGGKSQNSDEDRGEPPPPASRPRNVTPRDLIYGHDHLTSSGIGVPPGLAGGRYPP